MVPTDPPEQVGGNYDTGADKYTARRMRQFVTWVLIPIIIFCGGGWYLLAGRPADQQTGILGAPRSTATRLPTRAITGDTVLGGAVSAGPSPTMVRLSAAENAIGPSVVCYARVDSQGVISNTSVLANGLFRAEGFTRVNGGMIWNSRFGWHLLSNFGCQAGLEKLEVEYIPPTPTRKPVIVPTRVPATVTPLPTLTPTITPIPGIVLFDLWDCHAVRWLAWGVSRVYLTIGTAREGVPGDNHGQFVQRDLCGFVGQKIRLDAFFASGTQVFREGVIQ